MTMHLFPELARPVADVLNPPKTFEQQIKDITAALHVVAYHRKDADAGWKGDIDRVRRDFKTLQDLLDAFNNDMSDGDGSGLEDAEANIICKLRQNSEPQDYAEWMTAREHARGVARYATGREP